MIQLFHQQFPVVFSLRYVFYNEFMNSRSIQNRQKEEILNKIPIFLAKTFRIVDNPAYYDTISWNAEGDAFIIKNVTKLTNEIFPQHFKHSNFLSFVRQLNMYGFHKVVCNLDIEGQVFKHQYFRHDATGSLLLIKRKNAPDESENQQIVAIPGRQQRLQKQFNILRSQHQELQNMMEILIQQNKTIAAQNKIFAQMMGQMREKYRKKLQTLMLLVLFGKKNHNNDYILPPQLSDVIETFQQINRNGSQLIMFPQKKSRNSNSNLPMLTHKQNSHGEKSEYNSQLDNEQKDDIFKIFNQQKSLSENENRSQKDEQQKLQKNSEFQWSQEISMSPLSATSRPEKVFRQSKWDDYLNRLEHSDYSELELEWQ